MTSVLTSAFIFAMLGSAISAYPIYRLLLALKSRQNVSKFAPEGHQQKQGTPTMGGLIVAVGFLVVPALQYLALYGQPSTSSSRQAICVFSLFLGFATIGFIDDFVVPRLFTGKRGLGWKQKILMQLFVAGLTAISMYGDASKECFGMVFLILFFSNAYNFSDGLDALASLLLIGFAGGLFVLAKLFGVDGLCVYLVALVGAILPFLYLNKPKAKIFMGDVGSLPIGAVLGMVVAVLIYPRGGPGFAFGSLHSQAMAPNPFVGPHLWWVRFLCVFIASGMMIVELVPVPLQILSVKLRKKKLFSFTPIHHAYERKGWPETRVVLAFAASQLFMSILACGIAVSVDSSGLNDRESPPEHLTAINHFSSTLPSAQTAPEGGATPKLVALSQP